MKKVFIMAIAVAAMTLTSCNNSKTNAPKADAEAAMTDSAANESTAAAEAPANADQLVEQLNEKVKAKDGKGLSELLTNAQTKMAELAQKNPQEAQEYITKLQQWMLDNSENLQAALKASGNEAAAEAIGAASKADAKAITEGMAKAQEAAKSVTPEQMEAAKKAAQEAAAKMQGKGGEAAQ